MVGRSDNRGGGVAGKDRADFRNTHIVATWRVAATRQRQWLEQYRRVSEASTCSTADWQWGDCPEVTAPM